MIVKISGGIGNQMFQYAFKKSLDKLWDKNFIDLSFFSNSRVHNGYELEKVFGIKDIECSSECSFIDSHKLIAKILYKFNYRIIKTDSSLNEILIDYYPSWNKLSGDKFYIDGYWQSEKYFDEICEEIRALFKFPQFVDDKNINILNKINIKNSVSLHVRRGDFLGVSKYVCLGKTDYYENAIKFMESNVRDPFYVIFSDDIEWCKKNLIVKDGIFVDWNTNEYSYRDMQLMSYCKHNIIANSSFSWWGAWLNQNPSKIVVTPDYFYEGSKRNESELIPKSWIKIKFKNRSNI